MTSETDFFKTLEPSFLKLVAEVSKFDFKLGLVGGSVRDFFLGVNKAKAHLEDYDCELRPTKPIANLEQRYSELIESLRAHYTIEDLPYIITRVKTDKFIAELSLPRVEKYSGEFHHSNFTAAFTADEDFKIGFIRRDFTINAILLEINSGDVELIDPLGGVEDLKQGILRPCSDSFSKDPVRFLRAIRFKLLLGQLSGNSFNFAPGLETMFLGVDLNLFPLHYLSTEMMKSQKPMSFLLMLSSLLKGSKNRPTIEQEIIDNFDSLWLADGKMNFLKNAFFLKDQRSQLMGALKLTDKKSYLPMPWRFKSSDIDESWVGRFKQLEQLPKILIQLYYKHGYTDLDIEDFEKIRDTEVSLDSVELEKRTIYSFKEKMKGIS